MAELSETGEMLRSPGEAIQAKGTTEEEALIRLDEAATQFQRDGRYLDALECMERGLILRHRMFGGRSPEVLAACKAAGELCNLLAMTYLQREDYAMVSELLKKAEILTEHDLSGKAVTFNNFACFSRQQGRLHASLSYLQKALAIEQKLPHVDTPADTHLNLCAVLSQLGRHREALEHSQQALMLLQEELFADGASSGRAAQKPDRIAVLAICYHNIGVECEFLKHYQASLQAYTKGVEIASVYLGATHGITQTLERSQAAARQAIDKAANAKRNSSRFSAGAIAAAGQAKKKAGGGGPGSPRFGGAAAAGAGAGAGRSRSVGRAPLRGSGNNNAANAGAGMGGMGMGMAGAGDPYGGGGGGGGPADGGGYGGGDDDGSGGMDPASAALLQQQMAMQMQMNAAAAMGMGGMGMGMGLVPMQMGPMGAGGGFNQYQFMAPPQGDDGSGGGGGGGEWQGGDGGDGGGGGGGLPPVAEEGGGGSYGDGSHGGGGSS